MVSPAKLSSVAIARILLATDFSFESQNAFYCAVSLSRRFGGKLFLTHVLPSETTIAGGEPWPALFDAMRQTAQQSMTELENAEELKDIPHESIIRSGDTWGALKEIIAGKDIELVVVGTRGHGGFAKLFLGSTAEKVIRHASCPVLTVGPHVEFTSLNRLHHIVYATDFSPGSLHALDYAIALAQQDGADMTLLHVIETGALSDSEFGAWQEQDRHRLMEMLPLHTDLIYQIEIEIQSGIPDAVIRHAADTLKADLIVMGSHSGGSISTHLPWSVLHRVLHDAHCAVLTVRKA